MTRKPRPDNENHTPGTPATALPSAPGIRGEELRRNRIPLYLQIAEIFRRRIAEGEWPVQEQLPRLEELVAEFQVARVTIRQALALLEQDGLIVRYRGKGSFVLKRPDTDHWLTLRTDLPSLEGTLRNADTRFIEIAPAPNPPHIEPHEGRSARQYQYLRREISRDGVIYAIVDVFLDHALYAHFNDKDLEQKSITGMLFAATDLGPFEGLQTMTIASADGEIANLLKMPINAPIARVRRVLRDPAGTVIYLAKVIYRGEFVRLDIKLE